MSHNYNNDSKLEMYQTQPQYYNQATYPTVPGTYPTTQGTYPTLPGSYPTSQGTYPTIQETNPAVPSVPSVTYPMEKGGVQTVCSQCHNQVVTSVDSSFNGSAIGWIIYSIFCCWPFAFFVCCMDNFKTWKHNCPNCRKLLAEFTPQASGGTTCGLVCAGIIMPIIVVLYFMCKYIGLV